MDIYASDEEKGEEIKQWWRDNGRSVILGCIVGAAVIFGGRYWLTYQQTLAANASIAYQQVVLSLNDDNVSAAEDKTHLLFSEYSTTPYAVFAAFEMAAQSTDSDSAKSYLEWIISNADLVAHKELARFRLAQLFSNDEKYEHALALIEQSESAAFSSLLLELQGDIFVAKSQVAEARTAYKNSMIDLLQGEPRKQILQVKLDDVAESDDS